MKLVLNDVSFEFKVRKLGHIGSLDLGVNCCYVGFGDVGHERCIDLRSANDENLPAILNAPQILNACRKRFKDAHSVDFIGKGAGQDYVLSVRQRLS